MRKRLLPQSVIIFLEKRYSIAKDLMLSFIKGVKKNKTSCERAFEEELSEVLSSFLSTPVLCYSLVTSTVCETGEA